MFKDIKYHSILIRSFCLLLLLAPLALSAQFTLLVDTGHITAKNGVQLVLKNTDWENNGVVNFDSSTVVFSGDSLQSIGGSASTAFFNIENSKGINNTELNQSISVSRNLDMQSGHLDLNGNDLFLGDSFGQILNENENAYIFGPLGGEIVKSLVLNAPNNVNPGNIGIAISSIKNMGFTTIRRGHPPIVIDTTESIARYFTVTPSNNHALDATISVYYLNAELNGNDEASLIPYQNLSSNWVPLTATTTDTSANFQTITGIDSLSSFTLKSSPSALPVELIYFDAEAQNNFTTLLSWETATEINNDFFTVERSLDGINFETITEVAGAGYSSVPRAYQTIDEEPFRGLNYYRLKQTDFDGQYSYSAIRPVWFSESDKVNVLLYPNPADEILIIQIDKVNENDKLSLYNALGQQVLNQSLRNAQQIDIRYLSRGVYFLHLTIRNETVVEQLVFK